MTGFDHYSDIKYTMVKSQFMTINTVNFFGDPRPLMISSDKYDIRCARTNMHDMTYLADGTWLTADTYNDALGTVAGRAYYKVNDPIQRREEDRQYFIDNKAKVRYAAAAGDYVFGGVECRVICDYFGWTY